MLYNDPMLLNAISSYSLYFGKAIPPHFVQRNSPDSLLKLLTEALVRDEPVPELANRVPVPGSVDEPPSVKLPQEYRNKVREEFLKKVASI
ncbi:MAG: hypothetical protein ACOY5W_06645 [Pseudomonadota bacterium]